MPDEQRHRIEVGPYAWGLFQAIPEEDWNALRLVRGVAEALKQLKFEQPTIYQELWDRELSLVVTGTVVALMVGEPANLKPFVAFRRKGPPYEGYWRQVVDNADDDTGPWLMIPDEMVGDAIGRQIEDFLGEEEEPPENW